MTQTKKQWPTWIIVVAILILIPPIVWALSLTMDILAAVGIGFVILVVAIVALFMYLNRRIND